jgi:hypothetical protein
LVVNSKNVDQPFGHFVSTFVVAHQLIVDQKRETKVDGVFDIEGKQLNFSRTDGNISGVVVLFLEDEGRPGWSSFEQFRMIADLPELHDQVHKIFYLGLGLKHLEEFFNVQFFLNRLVQQFLSLGHLTEHLMLYLLADLMFYVFLDAPQHEGFEDGMQSLDFDLVKFFLVLAVRLDIFGEPFIEELM